MSLRGYERVVGAALVAAATVLGAGQGARGDTTARAPTAQGIAAFQTIAAVLTYPRCLNCHQRDAPRQGDEVRIHVPRVVRGPDNMGVSAMRCANCHRASNNLDSGVPGAPQWQLAPASMAWNGLSIGRVCRAIQDPKLNGGRSLQELVEHMEHDALVRWGWNPGGNRAPIPIAHREFVDALKVWIAAVGVCPS
jgi:hypothetical protein